MSRQVVAPQRVRIRHPSGFGLAPLIALIALVAPLLSVVHGESPKGGATLSALALVAAVGAILVFRLPFIGIDLDGDRLIVRGWLTRRSILFADIIGTSSDPYQGFFLFMPFVGSHMLVLSLHDDRRLSVSVVIGSNEFIGDIGSQVMAAKEQS